MSPGERERREVRDSQWLPTNSAKDWKKPSSFWLKIYNQFESMIQSVNDSSTHKRSYI
jgi:hypothetical protein